MPYSIDPGGAVPASRRPRAHAPLCVLLALFTALAGCAKEKPKPFTTTRYPTLGPRKNLPPYLKGSVFEQAELANNTPYPVSSYGLVGQLRGTGSTEAPQAVRQWMTKELVRRGFGSPGLGYERIPPGAVLSSPDFAIVRVDAVLPPGARRGDRIDAFVAALPNETTSLAHGVLFEAELKLNGANPYSPSSTIDTWATTKGPVLVNPAYALDTSASPTGAAKASLRRGTVMFNGTVQQDRPLMLVLRQPQRSLARAIERRINDRFQHDADRPRKDGVQGYLVAEAKDEGLIEFYVPKSFNGDWERFAGVVRYLYLNSSVPFATEKAKELAAAAVQPKAPLLEISYAWEGLGAPALPFVSQLLSHPDPAVQFAAARAAAFIGDTSFAAQETLTRIAETRGHPFQISAIQVLGRLPQSTALSQMLRRLLDSPDATVRVEAYNVLADHDDTTIFSRSVRRWEDREKFVLDVVPSEGPPLIYASQRGRPRIAIIGRTPILREPVTWVALGQRLSISTTQLGERKTTALQVHYRDPRKRNAVRVLSHADVAELAARLGGEGANGEDRLDFTYGEVVAILQALSDRGNIVSSQTDKVGRQLAAAFVLQEASQVIDQIRSAPAIDEGRPQVEQPAGPVGMR